MKVRSYKVTLTPQVTAIIEAQIANGRFRDFSDAVQEAAYAYFVGLDNIFAEYGVTPKVVDQAARRELAAIEQARKKGKPKPFKQ